VLGSLILIIQLDDHDLKKKLYAVRFKLPGKFISKSNAKDLSLMAKAKDMFGPKPVASWWRETLAVGFHGMVK